MRGAQAGLLFLLGASACTEEIDLERRLSSFEVTLTTAAGTPAKRCPLPGTPTATLDLTGCPDYARESGGGTVVRVGFHARAIDNRGELYEPFNGLARVRAVPGRVASEFSQVRFRNGETEDEQVAFRSAFGDTYVWIVDDLPPPQVTNVPGLGRECGSEPAEYAVCQEAGMACVNAKPAVGFDDLGLAYCSPACAADDQCPDGYFCGRTFVAYGASVEDGACIRKVATQAAGIAGPIHLVEPNIADLSRADSLNSSPFQEEFVSVRRGKMIVSAVRIDGFYVTDVCPLTPEEGGPAADDPDCTPEERSLPEEFNHLFVFSFSRPESRRVSTDPEDVDVERRDLAAGDQITFVEGPMTEFVGLTELTFPLWEVDFEAGTQPVPPPISLHGKLLDIYPHLLARGELCFDPVRLPTAVTLLDCDFAMERLEAARVSVRVKQVVRINPGSREANDFTDFGQWPVIIDAPVMMGRDPLTFLLVTRENIPFFNPLQLGDRLINEPIIGNLRQVAFDDRDPPKWIIEPRDQGDCSWCTN